MSPGAALGGGGRDGGLLTTQTSREHRETLAPQSGVAPRPEPGVLPLDLEAAPTPALPFFVGAVGASAGGLEALQDLFRHVSAESGLCFVVIQHLPLDFKSALAQLLGRQTALPVLEIEDGSSPLANCIHIVPAHGVVTLEAGRFCCRERDAGHPVLPINAFLTSLAHEQADQGAALILSGTGSDGTHGARVLREAGGLVLAQEPASAKFDGMPNSVIHSGSVD